jgi:hypothetical protein
MAKRNKGVGHYTSDRSGLTRVNPPNYMPESGNAHTTKDIYSDVTANAEVKAGF